MAYQRPFEIELFAIKEGGMAVPAVSRLARLHALIPIRTNDVHRPTQAAPPARREAGAHFQMSKSKRLLVKVAIFSSGSCLRSSIPHVSRLVLENLPQKILQLDFFIWRCSWGRGPGLPIRMQQAGFPQAREVAFQALDSLLCQERAKCVSNCLIDFWSMRSGGFKGI